MNFLTAVDPILVTGYFRILAVINTIDRIYQQQRVTNFISVSN
jgi:hypothetical protein